MAPPSNRSGTNRKAQLSVFTAYVLASVGALLGAALLVISLWQPQAISGLRSMAVDATSSAGEAGASARTGGEELFRGHRGLLPRRQPERGA